MISKFSMKFYENQHGSLKAEAQTLRAYTRAKIRHLNNDSSENNSNDEFL